MFRSCHIIIRELCFLLKLCYSIHNSISICKRGVVAAYHVMEQWLGVRLMLSNKGIRVAGFSLSHGYQPNQPHRNSNPHRNKNTQPM